MIKVLWIDDECKDIYGNLSHRGRQFIDYAIDKGTRLQTTRTCLVNSFT